MQWVSPRQVVKMEIMGLSHARARQIATIDGIARCALGAAAFAAPGLPLTPWVGDAGQDGPVRLLARALGCRDVALGVGALMALRHDAPVRGWVEAGGLADAGDVAVTLGTFRALPRRGRWLVLAAASAGAIAAVLVAPSVDALAPSPSGSSATVDGRG
jgi:hypothetical protein